MSGDLFTATRPHDLPPRWDGHPVEWHDWALMEPVFVCPPQRRECCPRCGSTADQPCNRGSVRINPRTELESRRSGRLGRPIFLSLVAFRCPDCCHDQVLEVSTSRWWDLDPDDYLDDGSFAEGDRR